MNKEFKLYFQFVFYVALSTALFCGCSAKDTGEASSGISNQVDIQGHRGARGLFPENTVTAFIEAVKLGITTLEMDVIVSKDSLLVVSHEAWMNDAFCFRPDGVVVEKNSKELYNLYKLNYSEILKFDCGKNGNANFPLQKHIHEHKPLLSEVINIVEAYTKENNLPAVKYSIETKSDPLEDGIFNPDPKTFIRFLYTALEKQNILDRVIIQSFDVRTLQELKKKDAQIKTALLIDNNDGLAVNIGKLGFNPTIYSPDFHLINDNLVKDLHEKNIQLIPWTVNEIKDMKILIDKGVDGIITDYPDSAVIATRELKLKK